MNEYTEKFETICKELDSRCHDIPQINSALQQHAPQVRPAHVVFGSVAFVFFLLFGYFFFEQAFLVSLVGFFYPALQSVKAIESKEQDDDTQWLTYWVIYCFFSLVEVFSDVICYYFPFYFLCKLALLCWCFLPQTRGALVVYSKVLKPFVLVHLGIKTGNEKKANAPAKAQKSAPIQQSKPKVETKPEPKPEPEPESQPKAEPKAESQAQVTQKSGSEYVSEEEREAVAKDQDEAYQKLMKSVDDHAKKRAEYYEKSKEAHNAGDGAKAKEFSELGKQEDVLMEEAKSNAGEAMFARANNTSDGTWCDLHGLQVDFALKKTEEFLIKVKNNGLKECTIITGAGNHSADKALIKPKVHAYLKESGYMFEEVNNGSILVEV